MVPGATKDGLGRGYEELAGVANELTPVSAVNIATGRNRRSLRDAASNPKIDLSAPESYYSNAPCEMT